MHHQYSFNKIIRNTFKWHFCLHKLKCMYLINLVLPIILFLPLLKKLHISQYTSTKSKI